MRVYPIEPKAIWRIAVSRRFSDPELSRYYDQHILPVLSREGLVMEASSASDTPGDINFWLRRMSLILEISDLHVFVDLRVSPSMWLEERKSHQVRKFGQPSTIITYLNWSFFDFRLFYRASAISIARLMRIVPLFPLGTHGLAYIGTNSFQRRLRRSIEWAQWRRAVKLRLFSTCLHMCSSLMKRFDSRATEPTELNIDVQRYLLLETEITTRILAGESTEELLSDEHLQDGTMNIASEEQPERFDRAIVAALHPMRLLTDRSQLEFARALANPNVFPTSFRGQYKLFLRKLYKAAIFALKAAGAKGNNPKFVRTLFRIFINLLAMQTTVSFRKSVRRHANRTTFPSTSSSANG
jgi:hypothetical protein